MAVKRWNAGQFQTKVRKQVTRRMRRAMLVLQGEVQRKLSRGQPVKRVGKTLVGLDPSTPGTSPKVVSSSLKGSITSEVKVERTAVVGRVGSNLEYARRQELGFIGTDSLGRNVHHEPRPYLRPAFKENISRMVRTLGGRPR